jgi:uncharacterized HAD superfamily protein
MNMKKIKNKYEKIETGLRFNDGKTRYDLLPPFAVDQLAKVMTKGAEKYADRNWEKGMKWSTVLASLKRHIAAFERGEDIDPETGLLHIAHAMCNAAFLAEYYKIYPEGDDRPHNYLKDKKIGLDIDGVIADFNGGLNDKFPELKEKITEYWNDPKLVARFKEVKRENAFWSNLKPLVKHKDIPFEPYCYITSRSIDIKITQKWLDDNGFPKAPLHCVGENESKVKIAKELNVDYFVDDKYENFVDLNRAGICCFLLDQPWNKRYNVGFKRIKTLNELNFGYKS